MSPDAQLVVIFGALHLVALLLGAVLFVMFLRSDDNSSWSGPDEDDGGGGGGNDRISPTPKTNPSGGIPLPDAVQSDVRLRSAGDKLADPSRRMPSRRRVSDPVRERPRVPAR
jgi:hypothetical protein